MTHKQKSNQTKNQVRELMKALTEITLNKVDKAITSGAVPDYFYEDNYLLAKAVICSVMKDEPFAPHTDQYRKDFSNIHVSI